MKLNKNTYKIIDDVTYNMKNSIRGSFRCKIDLDLISKTSIEFIPLISINNAIRSFLN